MNRILIIGISATGKSTLARKLSDFYKIPITHYDELVWAKNWIEVDEKIVEQKLEEIVKKDRWIIEWYIHPAARVRLEQADIVLYLDYSGLQSVLGGLTRWWQHRGRTRPEMAEGCIEKLELDYLKVMWKRKERQDIEDAIKGYEDKIVRLKSRKETDSFLEQLFFKNKQK